MLLDLLQRRAPFDRAAAQLFAAVEMKQATGFVAGHTLTTVFYIMRRGASTPVAESAVLTLLRVLQVVPVEREDLMRALSFGGRITRMPFRLSAPRKWAPISS